MSVADNSSLIDLERLERLRAAGPAPGSALLSPERILARTQQYTVFYGPFNWKPSRTARLIIVGLTPGYTQLEKANEVALEIQAHNITDPDEIAALGRSRVAFFGSMRTNLITMLTDLRLPRFLGIDKTSDLFSTDTGLLFTTSALLYPVFTGAALRNFSGAPHMMDRPLFQEMVRLFLAPLLEEMPDALILPLGQAAESAVTWLQERDVITADRFVRGFPHPSGANGHRLPQFRKNFDSLSRQFETWFGRRSSLGA